MSPLQDLLNLNMASPVAVLILVFGLPTFLLFSWVVILGIYNVFFHPLSGYPGPKLHAATRLTWTLDVLSGTSAFKLSKMHEKYGQVVRIAPNELSYTNSKIWKEVYGSQKVGSGQMQKDPLHYQKFDTTPSLHVSSDADHTRMRRLISHAFSDKALRGQEPIIQNYADLLMSRLQEIASTGGVANIKQWFHWTVFDLFGDLCFGESFGCLREGKSHPWVEIIGESIEAFVYIALSRRIPGLQKLIFFMIPKKKIEQAAWHAKFSKDLANKRIAMVTDRPDFMSFILKHNDEKGLSEAEIHSNSNVLVMAGSHTTAAFLTSTTYQLLKNPMVYKSLVEEIRGSFNTAEDITTTNLLSLKYLAAVIEEGMRIYPPAPSNMPRVIPKEGAMICGKWVPGGTSVCMAQYVMFHNSANFTDPDSFIPERWLDDPRFASDDKTAFQPFSFGPRNCIGKNLAYAEMRLVLAKLLWNFDIELQPESDNWFPQKMMVNWMSPDLHVKLHTVSH